MKKKKSPKKRKYPPGMDKMKGVHIVQYDITSEPIEDKAYRRLPRAVNEQLERFHGLSQSKPEQALPELLKLKEKYPQVPQIYNYLTVAYARLGKLKEAEAVARECIRKHPDYLFGRLNLA